MTDTAEQSTDNGAMVEHYVRFWNAQTPEEQRRLASTTFTDDVHYYAPIGILIGAQAMIDFHDQFTAHMGPATFRPRKDPEIHHGRARLRWEIEVRGGESFSEGTDVLVFAADGRISSVNAFLDRAPEGFDPHAHG